MNILLDARSTNPLYVQILKQIKAAIVSGELEPGEKLPSMRALANSLNVSVLTTKRVYEELEKEGYIISQVGKGSFVARDQLPLIIETQQVEMEQYIHKALDIAKQLNISNDEFISLIQLILNEGSEKE